MVINKENYQSIYKIYTEFVRVKGQNSEPQEFIVLDTDIVILSLIEKFIQDLDPRRYSELINGILIDAEDLLQLRPHWFIVKNELKNLYNKA